MYILYYRLLTRDNGNLRKKYAVRATLPWAHTDTRTSAASCSASRRSSS